MEKDIGQSGNFAQKNIAPDDRFQERRVALTRLYEALPPYGSLACWHLLEGNSSESTALPLEVLVKVLREAVARDDEQTQRRLFEIIVARLQMTNEQWVSSALASMRILPGEQHALAADLYADLCELLLRSLRNCEQHFWEEHFYQCLHFARKHVYERFMRREGRWRKVTPGLSRRIPSALMESLERSAVWEDAHCLLDVPDGRAEQALLAVEQAEIVTLVLRLPMYLRSVVWLIFWEDHTTKTVSRLLNISERTVRNRLRAALAQLRAALEAEQEMVDGRSA